eukprot:10807543-Alexandrium_andersonii.AAC.1
MSRSTRGHQQRIASLTFAIWAAPPRSAQLMTRLAQSPMTRWTGPLWCGRASVASLCRPQTISAHRLPTACALERAPQGRRGLGSKHICRPIGRP